MIRNHKNAAGEPKRFAGGDFILLTNKTARQGAERREYFRIFKLCNEA